MYCAAEALHGRSHDRKPQSAAAGLAGTAFVYAIKPVKNFFQILFVHAYAGVDNGNLSLGLILCESNSYRAARFVGR